MVGLGLLAIALILVPLLAGDRLPLRVVIMNELPYVFIIALWIGLITGFTRPAFISGAAILIGVIAVVVAIVESPSAPIGGIFMSLLPFGIIVALLALVPYSWARAYRANPLLKGDMTVELAPDELKIVRATNTMSHRWSAIVRAAETPAFFLFFVTKASAHYLPKRVIPPEDLPDLRAFLRAHVPSGLL